jgi:hypothetical protein
MYIHKSEYKDLWSKEINVEYFPTLPVITCGYTVGLFYSNNYSTNIYIDIY